jgi:hypothetical protein
MSSMAVTNLFRSMCQCSSHPYLGRCGESSESSGRAVSAHPAATLVEQDRPTQLSNEDAKIHICTVLLTGDFSDTSAATSRGAHYRPSCR